MITSQIETITPEIAKSYLLKNTDNRPLKKGTVNSLCNSIKAGEWQLSHQGIAFSETGRLIDGQHRLSAVSQCGISCDMVVTRGLPDSVFQVVDRHAKRTLHDNLKIDRKLIEVTSFALALATGKGSSETTAGEIKAASDMLEHYHTMVFQATATDAKTFSSTPCRLAAMTALYINRNNHLACMEICSMYRDLVLCNTANFTTSMHGIYKQSLTGALGGGGTFHSKRIETYLKMSALFSSLDRSKKLIRASGKDFYTSVLQSMVGKHK